ncbi:hypothetical protein [Psychromonas aquimarina]|uniref:hypothetical protein n=1 Tax=Psychromonas aquimarina TaxID=444919 RepID=UPI00040FBFA3|nr:hypothetical protein [Psychromonas aquimarina]
MHLLKKSNIFTVSIITLLSPSICQAQFNTPSLTIRTASGSAVATIYANGRMQAKLNVSYSNIPDGYTVDNVVIKEAYINNNLPSYWVVSSIDNGYDHNMSNSYQTLRTRQQNLTTIPLYLSTLNSDADITLCAELEVSNTYGNNETLSTCEGDTNNGLVSVIVLQEINYGIEDLDHSRNREWYGNTGASYAISNDRFTLRNNREIRDVGGCNTSLVNNGKRYLVSSTNGPEHPYSNARKFSAAYLFYPNQGVVSSNFSYSNGSYWRDTVSLNFNTTNSIVFAWLNGQDNQNTYVNPLISWTIHCSTIAFRDNYGNDGILNLSRHSNPDDEWGNVYYSFH